MAKLFKLKSVKKKARKRKLLPTSKTLSFCSFCSDAIEEVPLICKFCKDAFHQECVSMVISKSRGGFTCSTCLVRGGAPITAPTRFISVPIQNPVPPELIYIKKEKAAPIEEDEICVLCDGECTCGITVPSNMKYETQDAYESTAEFIDIDSLDELSNPAITSDTDQFPDVPFATGDLSNDRYWIEEADSEDDVAYSIASAHTDSAESSVYEEPEDENSDEDIMVEIVRERLLNGWEDSEEEDFFSVSDHENEDRMLQSETAAIQFSAHKYSVDSDRRVAGFATTPVVPMVQLNQPLEFFYGSNLSSINVVPKNLGFESTPLAQKVSNASSGPPATAAPKSFGFDIKKTLIGPNGEITTTTKNIKWQSQGSVAYEQAKKKKSTTVVPAIEQRPFHPSSTQEFKKPNIKNLIPASISSNPWFALKSIQKSSESSPKPYSERRRSGIPLNHVSSLISSPAAIKVFSDLRKIETATMELEGSLVKSLLFTHPGVGKAVEELERILGSQRASSGAFQSFEPTEMSAEEKDAALFEDIFDQAGYEEALPTPPEEVSTDVFSRFDRIPIGTFWNSQRSRGKIAKRKDLARAIKKSSDSRILDSTLLENMRKIKSARRRSVQLFSPILVATTPNPIDTSVPPSQSLDFLANSYIPPPFEL